MKAEELMIGDWVNLTYRDYISGEVVSKDYCKKCDCYKGQNKK